MTILGFDCSTNTAGYAFCKDGEIVNAGFVDISKFETNKDKAFGVINHLETLPELSTINHINLEAALSGFASGFTSQQVLIKLTRFNAIFEYIISERWKKPINLINVNTGRKKVLGHARIKGMKNKEMVKMLLPNVVKNIHKFDIKNKKGNIDKRMEDVWDAIVMSLYE
jgi:hypothetical protein